MGRIKEAFPGKKNGHFLGIFFLFFALSPCTVGCKNVYSTHR